MILNRARFMPSRQMKQVYSAIAVAAMLVFLVGQLVLTNGSANAQSACVVVNTADTGAGSLRDLVATANIGNCINNEVTFDESLAGQTILLSTPLEIVAPADEFVTIKSTLADQITVTGNLTRAFNLNFNRTLNLEGFTIANSVIEQTAKPPTSNDFNFGKGGAIVMEDQANLSIKEMIFANNSAFEGGVIFSRGTGSVTVDESTFYGNRSISLGGVIRGAGSTIDVSNSTFYLNENNSSGGVIYHQDTFSNTNDALSVSVVNSTFDRNTGDDGAILYMEYSQGTFVHNTVTNNQIRTGAVYNASGELILANNIFDGNFIEPFSGGFPNNTCRMDEADGNPQATTGVLVEPESGNNISPDSTCNPGNLSGVDPLMGTLVDGGGPTLTISPQAGSPAIDGAKADQCLPTDQRGVSRPVGDECDIGAVEVVSVDLAVEKLASADPVIPGEQLVYTIIVSNVSSVTAFDVNVVDVIDPSVAYAPGTITGVGADDANANSLEWDIPAILARCHAVRRRTERIPAAVLKTPSAGVVEGRRRRRCDASRGTDQNTKKSCCDSDALCTPTSTTWFPPPRSSTASSPTCASRAATSPALAMPVAFTSEATPIRSPPSKSWIASTPLFAYIRKSSSPSPPHRESEPTPPWISSSLPKVRASPPLADM
ncbi:MAG: choice-of-anchor Q domain-containing protein [Chloroflexota bacterium]